MSSKHKDKMRNGSKTTLMLMESFKTNGSSQAEVSNSKGDPNNSSNVDTGVSPATTESRSSLGMRKSTRHCSYKNRHRVNRLKQKQNQRMFKDTNTIYPPNQAYNDANNELKSPTKKRPQSGGPSPDKLHITLGDCSDSEQVSAQLQLKECEAAKEEDDNKEQQYNRIFQDH